MKSGSRLTWVSGMIPSFDLAKVLRFLSITVCCAAMLMGMVGKSEAAFDQLDDFAGLANGTSPSFGNWTGVNGSDGTNGWVVLSGTTASGTTGPTNGNPDPYVYLESSASSQTYGADVTAGSSQYIESNVLDAGINAITFTFDWNMNVNDNTDASLHVDAWNGISWNLDVTGGAINTGNNNDVWVTEGPIDFSSYSNADFKVRIRYIVGNGTIYNNDVAVDNLHLVGTDKCTPGSMTAPAGPSVSGNPLDICTDITLAGGAGPITNVTITEGPNLDDNFNDASVDGKWTKTDIGPDATSAPVESGGTLQLFGGGADIWNAADEFTYLHQQISGDFTMDINVQSLTVNGGNAWHKSGLMARETLNGDSVNVAMLVTQGNGVTFQNRPTTGATSVSQADAVGSAPKWIRIQRSGNSWRGYWSDDGVIWTENTAGAVNVTMPDTIYIGMAVTSHVAGTIDSANFDDFVVTGAGTTLYNGASCSGIDTTGWSSGIKNVDVTADDGCSGTLNDSGTIDYSACTDTDLATLTTATDPVSPVSGTTTVYATVGNETAPDTMGGMQVTITGSSSCDATGAAMTWNAGNSRWEYIWDTSACGTSAVESGVAIDVSGTDPDCSNPIVNAPQISVDIDNTCTETGTVSLDAVPNPITGDTVITATVGGGASAPMVRWSVDGGPWSLWQASGTTFTPPSKSFGTVDFEARATGNCGGDIFDTNNPTSTTYETRVDALEPQTIQEAAQSSLTSIQVRLDYCNDKNNTGTFLVEYKLASSGAWLTAANTPTPDGGAGDNDGILNEEVVVIIGGLNGTELYDVRMTYVDDIDGVIGTAIYTTQVQMVEWTDQPMLHNSNRFTGTTKHGGGWGKPGTYAGAIQCTTCHEKNPANGNIKRVRETISFPDGSTMPGGGISANVVLTSAVDGSADFGDDSTAPRTSSNRVCEVCHTYDLGNLGTKFHAADQGAVSGHYDNADCVKCHEHNIGFKASCDSCHDSPPIDSSGLVANGSTPGDATGSTTAGRHVRHANELAFDCNTCHTGWENTAEMPNGGNLNIGFVTPGANGGTYDGRSGGAYTADGGTGTSVTLGDGLSCALYCHGYDTPLWNDTDTVTCGGCHGEEGSFVDDRAGAPTGGTSLDLSGAGSGFKIGKHGNHLDDSIAETGDPCLLCHPNTGHASGLDGSVDVSLHSNAGVSANYTTGSPGTCSNLACHSDANWDSTATGGCNFCHGYPPNSTNNSHAAGVNAVNHDSLNITPNHDQCSYCHGYKDNGSGLLAFVDVALMQGDTGRQPSAADHQDGQVTMNGDFNATAGDDAGYNATNGGCDSAACHANDAAHQLGGGNTGNPISLYDIGPGSCGTCHDTGVGGAPVVTSASSHVTVTRAAVYGDCTDCHTGHTSASGGVNIPNNSTVGISYTAAGHSGIKLGGPGTHVSISGQTTEAQICWGCHDNDGSISEWGTNTGTGSTYDYGSLNSSNWTTATWTSGVAKFSYKTGAIQSTHSVNSSATGPGLDAVGDIRCSYCHDVHDLNLQASDGVSGAPYLRGTWTGNPYPEDGAPLAGDTYTANGRFGAVPRGGNQANELGGFQIDQNNGNPTNGWTANGSAGLCELCHGNGDGNFTAAEIDSLNQFGTASTDWVGTNGHSAAVLGGGDSVAANIFSISDRNVSPPTFVNDDADRNNSESNPAMAYQQVSVGSTGNRGFGFRSASSEPDGWNLAPRTTNDRAHDDYNWGADTNTNLDSNYHNFSCSKCHNPHASRLPRLMITNCLDTKHNTWDDQASVDSIPAEGTNNNDGGGQINAENANVTFSNTTSAQNCHRVKDPAFSNSRGAGWNNVTPW